MRTIHDANLKTRHLMLFAALAALYGCHDTSPPPAPVPTVSAGTVKEQVKNQQERYSASVYPNAQVPLMFKSGGVVAYIRQARGGRLIGPGDTVTAGQDLARVRSTEYEAQLHQQQSQVEQADAQLKVAQAAETLAKLTYDRASVLYEQASLTKPNYDQAKASYDQAKASVEQAKAAGATARAAVAQVQVAVGDTTIRSPFNGSVVQRNIEIGDLAGPTSPAFVLIDTHIVKALFAIPESALPSVHLGQHLNIKLDAFPHDVSGAITSIAPAADPKSRVFTIELTIANPRNAILPGTIGSIALAPPAPALSHLLVPLSAVIHSPHTQNGVAVLLVEERGGHTYAHAQDFTSGDTYGNSVEARSGLSAGQRIIILGAQLVKDGQEIRILQSE